MRTPGSLLPTSGGTELVIGALPVSAGPLRLLLAGSDARLRERMRAVVEARPQMLLVGAVPTGENAVATVAELAPDVLILDMEMAGAHACSVTRSALALRPQLGIVGWIELVDSAGLPDEKAVAMQHVGRCCCVDSGADDAEIEQAIVSAAAGTPVLSRRLLLRASLTPREYEVLALTAAGWTAAHIARTLMIAPATVYRHTARICRKLGLERQADMAEAGRALGLGCDRDTTTDLDAYYAAYQVKREEWYRAWRASGR
jgi:DNA-binding NarL/FixJ family response regulator